MGHTQQLSLQSVHWKHRYSHGGVLRQKRRGRGARPLSTKDFVHLVFKANKKSFRRGFRSPLGHHICKQVIKKYSKRFFVKIDQIAICNDHIHILVRLTRRSLGQYFFRVVAGQIAQEFQRGGFLKPKVTDTLSAANEDKKNEAKTTESLWLYRPFSRVIKSYKAYKTARVYVKLNELEAQGWMPYKKERLKGLSPDEWEFLWSSTDSRKTR